jgi:peptidyl-tRNA hydrolase, PTH1 family
VDTALKVIVGLGNPGPTYEHTRHNAGAWFIRLLGQQNTPLRFEAKFHGLYGRMSIEGNDCHLLIPGTFMNHSGQAVAAITRFFKIAATNVLVAHDELDLPVGTIRLKQNGGHGGHNGLRDIISHLGTPDFLRLRVGIGHPGDSSQVLNYVLGQPPKKDTEKIHDTLTAAMSILPYLVQGKVNQAMQQLHTTV